MLGGKIIVDRYMKMVYNYYEYISDFTPQNERITI